MTNINSRNKIIAFRKMPVLPVILLVISLALLVTVAFILLHNDSSENPTTLEPQKRLLMCADGRRSSDFPWALSNTDQWPYVSDNIDIVKVYIGDFTSETDFEAVHLFVVTMKENNIKIALEVGGLLDWHADKRELSALYSFMEEYKQVKPFIDYVKEKSGFVFIDMIELDCPVRRMLFPFDQKNNYHNTETAVAELVKVIRLWRDVLPDVEINNITNFPVWGWKGSSAYFAVDGYSEGYGQYDLVLEEIVRQTTAANIKLTGITIDNPYDYVISAAQTNQPELIENVDWLGRLFELEATVKQYGLDVNIIFNSELGGNNSNMLFAQNTLDFIELYQGLGGRPDGYWIQSWYQYPNIWLPENKPYTITNLMKEVTAIIRNGI